MSPKTASFIKNLGIWPSRIVAGVVCVLLLLGAKHLFISGRYAEFVVCIATVAACWWFALWRASGIRSIISIVMFIAVTQIIKVFDPANGNHSRGNSLELWGPSSAESVLLPDVEVADSLVTSFASNTSQSGGFLYSDFVKAKKGSFFSAVGVDFAIAYNKDKRGAIVNFHALPSTRGPGLGALLNGSEEPSYKLTPAMLTIKYPLRVLSGLRVGSVNYGVVSDEVYYLRLDSNGTAEVTSRLVTN